MPLVPDLEQVNRLLEVVEAVVARLTQLARRLSELAIAVALLLLVARR